jgi:hypothetical protein
MKWILLGDQLINMKHVERIFVSGESFRIRLVEPDTLDLKIVFDSQHDAEEFFKIFAGKFKKEDLTCFDDYNLQIEN